MDMHNRKFRIKLAAGLTVVVSCLLFAAAVFNPSTQPTVLLGQYALQNRDLLSGDTIAYRPWFENGAWQGDIIEYLIDQNGNRNTDVAVGVNPPTQGSSGGCNRSISGCWSARATFRDNGGDDPTGSYWQNRHIFTHVDSVAYPSASNIQIPLTWDQLSDTQRQLLDLDEYNAIQAQLLADPTLTASALNTATASEILNYVLGKRLHEKQNDTQTGSLGNLRNRYSLLGDITGTPVYIGPPKELLRNVNGFSTFATNNASRAGRIAVGANDGMLHVFDEDDGSEVYAYVPSMVLDKLGTLAGKTATYNHTYFVDGELTVNSVQIGSSTPVWHTLLTGGGGAGFEGLFALDVTNPAYTTDKLLFEKTGGHWGHIYGAPAIGFIGSSNADPTWYIFTGNGYKTTSGQPTSLMMVNLDTQAVTEISTGTTGGLSAVTLLSTDADDQAELAFAGDINGDLWMFEIDQSNPANTIATKIYDGSPDQPISNAPAVAKHPTENGYMIYFGTGSIFSLDDARNDGLVSGGNPANQNDYTDKQTIHGLWLDTSNLSALKASGNLPYTSANLQAQTLSETSKVFVTGNPAEHVRIVPSPTTVYYSCPFGVTPCPTLKQGWKVDFPNCGERLVGSPFVRAGRVQFVTTNPTGPTPNCGTTNAAGDSWVMSLDYMQGSDNNKIVYNLNADQVLDSGDAVQVSGVDKSPVGLNLGPGNISQPTFARLRAGIDKMFINGIQLPISSIPHSADIPGGHIDVVTDSPNNVPDIDEIAPNAITKHSEGYDVRVNDGLGRAVDGLVHNYDGIHDVDYVDLFTLEPRRGKSSMVAALGITASGPVGTVVCSAVQNTREVLVTIGTTDFCIPAVEGELNRAYDILHQDRDGVIEPLHATDASGNPAPYLQSEVNALNDPSAAPFTAPVPAKQFIVTLANADLSKSATLQIGCKTWPVVDYQNWITTKLRDGRTSTSGLVDSAGDSLVFTLTGILADTHPCPGTPGSTITAAEAVAKGLSTTPTIRIGFGQRSILDGGIVATRSQCVLGLHNYTDPVCYSDEKVLTAAKSAIAAGPSATAYVNASCSTFSAMPTPPTDYIRNPDRQLHITQAQSSEGKGYRWRNGALTLQLIDAGINPTTALQKAWSGTFTSTPTYNTMLATSGVHAKAYTVAKSSGKDVIDATEASELSSPDESGLLYEAAMFWHYSQLVDDIRNSDPTSNSSPKDAACYAGGGYNGQTTIDAGGLTLGEYQKLTAPLVADCVTDTNCSLNQYFALVDQLDNASSETERNEVLAQLAELLASDPDLKAYADMRDYVGDKIPEQHKLEGDKAQGSNDNSDFGASGDGTPAQVTTIETIDLEAKGPNYVNGRRNWIDIRQ